MPDLLRIATAGSVDDGKSTLIGRLLLDSKSLLDDQGEDDLAHVTDGLRAEREQGITIDVAYRFFATARRSFILADTPGHVRYTRNMVTGASTADLALVLIDARKGLLEQSRRHAYLAALLGIRHLVACVNKMDLVAFDEARFREIETAFGELGAQLGIVDVRAVPISALRGRQRRRRARRGWPGTTAPPLLEQLETVEIDRDRNLDDVRFPVQWTVRGDDYRGYAGRVAGGVLATGDEVVVLPVGLALADRARSTRRAGRSSAAVPPMVATLRLEDELDVGRGDLVVGAARRARRSRASSTRPSAGWSRRRRASARATCSSTRRAGCGRTSPRSTRGSTSILVRGSAGRASWGSTTSGGSRCAPRRRCWPTRTRPTARRARSS